MHSLVVLHRSSFEVFACSAYPIPRLSELNNSRNYCWPAWLAPVYSRDVKLERKGVTGRGDIIPG